MSGYIDYEDAYPSMTPEQEDAAIEAEWLEASRWPIEDDAYEALLDEQAGAA